MTRKMLLGVAFGAVLAAAGSTAARAEDVYIPLISKGFQHQFWQAVKLGAGQAAKEANVKITFEGPETEAMVDKQIDMLSAALAKKPSAIGFAALDSKAAIPLLKKAHAAKIPVRSDRGHGRQADRHALGRARQKAERDRLRRTRLQGCYPVVEEGARCEDPGPI